MITMPDNMSRKIALEIKGLIEAGILAQGMRVSSLKQLATKYDTCVSVVRNSFRMLEKDNMIETRHGSGTYVSNKYKDTSRVCHCGVITSYTRGYIENYFEDLIEAGLDLGFSTSPILLKQLSHKRLNILMAQKPKAIFIDLEARLLSCDEIEALTQGVPLCYLNRWEWQRSLPKLGVFVDYNAAMLEGLKLLAEKGHKRILFVGPHSPIQTYMEKRLQNAIETLRLQDSYNVEVEIIGWNDLKGNQVDNTDRIKKLFTVNRPTAMLASSDYLAYLLLKDLRDINSSWGQIETIGFFDTYWSKIPGHEFASFKIDFRDMWSRAFNLLNKFSLESEHVEWITPQLISPNI